VTDAEYAMVRAEVLAGQDPPAALLDDCRRSVELLVRTAGLPAHYSPDGVWSPEAVEEVYADWVATRGVERGQLRAMLQRAPVLRVFRRMVETSVRQHLIDGLKRSQATNLYERVTRLLIEVGRFTSHGSGAGRLWHLADGPEAPFDGDDRRLLGVAWSLGEFRVIRYDPQARKLSPLLEAEELERFVTGMLAAGAMTAATIVHALRLRFGLDPDEPPGELDDGLHSGGSADPQAAPIIEELVTATLAELTERQAKILMGRDRNSSGRELAVQLGCSTGTVSNELRRIEDILARLGTDAPEVLKHVLDALFHEDV
jgi:hypothetical protein